jgi:hypothetical protein
MPILPAPVGAEILGAMITPAVLISACGTLVMSTVNRLGRVVDRIRVLTAEAEKLEDGTIPAGRVEDRRAMVRDQLEQLLHRLRLLQRAIAALYLAIGLLVMSSLMVGVTFSVRYAENWLPVTFGMAGAGSLLFASSLFVRETRVAVRSTEVEVGYARRLTDRVARRQATDGTVPPHA